MNLLQNIQEITDILLNSGNIDKEYTSGYRTVDLYNIVKSNNFNMLRYLLEGKSNVSPSALASVLWYSISHEYHEITKLLIEKGADVNQRGIRDHFYDPRISLLSWAVYCKNKHAVKLLLKHRAKVNDWDLLGMGALYFAISKKRVKIARMLLEYGANISCKDDNGNSMLHVAAATGMSDLINLVTEYSADVNNVNIFGQNVLHYAVQSPYDFKHIVVLLVKLGVPVNGQDIKGETPLHYALSLRKNRMAEALIENDAIVNAVSKDGMFPLFLAVASECSNRLVKFILNKGADIHKKTIDGETVLHYSCKKEDHEKIAILLQYGADVNSLNRDEKTALSLIKTTSSIAAKFLVHHIAKLKKRNSFILEENMKLIEKNVDLLLFFDKYCCVN